MTTRRALAGNPRQPRDAGYHDEGRTCSRVSASLYPRSRKGRFRSGQTGQTVNLLALRLRWFESSPAQFFPAPRFFLGAAALVRTAILAVGSTPKAYRWSGVIHQAAGRAYRSSLSQQLQ